MEIVSEVTQTATVATLVASTPTIRIVDQQGRPLSGLNVVFTTRMSTSKYSTSSDGTASTPWRLGTGAGRQMLIAAVQGLSIPADTFFAVAVADTATTLTTDVILAQAGLAGTPVGTPPGIIVTDAFGNVKSGIHVTFEAASGGTVTPSEATTDETGRAGVRQWTLGPDFGENKLIVRALTLAPLTFTARVNIPLVAASVVTGARHSCALTATGDVYCWGADDQRQLGTDGISSATPVRVKSVPQLVSLASRGDRTCGISNEAPPQVYCWGEWLTPVRFDTPNGLASITLGDQHACGLDPFGRAFCWGDGSMGQLGTGVAIESSPPVPVAGNLSFVALAAGAKHTCGLTAEGKTFCWGLNDHAQLGSVAAPNCFTYDDEYYYYYYDTVPVQCALVPQPVNTDASFVAISAGYGTCGLTSGGDVSCAGFGDVMRPVSNGVRFSRLSANAMCGLTSDGIAQCWTPIPGSGDTLLGTPLGDGNGMLFSSVATGNLHQCGVLATDGSVVCWGSNDSGQLGNGTKAPSYTPLPVARPVNP